MIVYINAHMRELFERRRLKQRKCTCMFTKQILGNNMSGGASSLRRQLHFILEYKHWLENLFIAVFGSCFLGDLNRTNYFHSL